MEIMIWILFGLISWIAAVFICMHVTKEKLGARSDLLGIGMANMVIGYIWHEILERRIIEEIWWKYEIPLMTGILSFLCLILGLSGIILMVADIVKAINELDRP